MGADEVELETQAVGLPVKAFSELVLGKAIVVLGGDAILAEAIQKVSASGDEALFNVYELEKFHWGKIFVVRHFLNNGTTTFLLKVRGSDGKSKKDFVIPRDIVVKAVSEDASLIATALMNDMDAMGWIGREFEPSFSAAVEKAKIAFVSNAAEPTKTGSGPLRA